VEEFVELADWYGWRAPHEPIVVDSLPTPTFSVKDRQQVSFSTNNYLGIATSPRMKAAALRGVEVPLKSARLRIQLNAGHRRDDIDHLVDVLRRNQHLAEPARRPLAAINNRAAGVEHSLSP
jgi:7-keto-8-aminopelargonate synthetase-like enzyme